LELGFSVEHQFDRNGLCACCQRRDPGVAGNPRQILFRRHRHEVVPIRFGEEASRILGAVAMMIGKATARADADASIRESRGQLRAMSA